MRTIGWIFLAGVAMAQAQAPSFQPVGSMRQLMIDIIYPTSDSIFYIDRAEPKNEVDWNAFRGQALMLAESANLIMMPGRARDQGDWIKYSRMMLEAGSAAYKAGQAKDMDGIRAVNDQLYNSCVSCHQQYRPDYRKGPPRR